MPNDTTPTKVCKKCGQEFPATPEFFYKNNQLKDGLYSNCKKCHNLLTGKAAAAWQKANPERAKAIQIRHKEKHRQRDLEINRLWRKANPEKVLAIARRRRAQYPEKNRIGSRIRMQRRKARKRNLPDTFTKEQWIACLEYFHYCCAVCGNQLRDLFGNVEPHADHWIPLSYEGDGNPGTVAENMVCLCNGCNRSKWNKLPDEWLIERFGTRKANQILARVQAYFNKLQASEGNHEY